LPINGGEVLKEDVPQNHNENQRSPSESLFGHTHPSLVSEAKLHIKDKIDFAQINNHSVPCCQGERG
jgi:hypothetical protein